MNIQNGRNALRDQYIWNAWHIFQAGCLDNAGVDDMVKPLCSNPNNSSFTKGEKAGTKRCNILACPRAKKQVYDQAKKYLINNTTMASAI